MITRIRGAVCILFALAALTPGQALAQQCQIRFTDYNQNRALSGGGMTLECPGEASRPPWGNWSVDSPHGVECINCGQFMGWANAERPDDWNSCNYGVYALPGYYNNTPPLQTFSPVGIFANYLSDPLPWPCSDYGDVYTLSGLPRRLLKFSGGSGDILRDVLH